MGTKGSKGEKSGKNKNKKNKVLQVLVAGSAQSGKSTFFKQLQLIHFEKFADEQKSEVLKTLRSNTILGFKELVEAADELKKWKLSSKLKSSLDFFRQKNPFDTFDEETKKSATALWNDKVFQKIWDARDTIPNLSILHLDYCMKNLERLTKDEGDPTTEDVLLARKRTTGTNEISFEFKGKEFRFVDVGGQRSERRHWDQIIEQPEAVIYFVSLPDFNLPTIGNPKTTKLEESLSIWEEVLQLEPFKSTLFILMFNKIDLFKEKLERVDFKETFPEYEGDKQDSDQAASFIRDKFLAIMPPSSAESVQSHVTCALDTEQMKTVFGAMQTAMLERLMSSFGML